MKRTRIDRFKVKSKMPIAPTPIATFEELAAIAGISQTTIYSAIDSYSWRAATLDAIANALNVPSISLLTIDDVEPNTGQASATLAPATLSATGKLGD